jgi:hypothetical protein
VRRASAPTSRIADRVSGVGPLWRERDRPRSADAWRQARLSAVRTRCV